MESEVFTNNNIAGYANVARLRGAKHVLSVYCVCLSYLKDTPIQPKTGSCMKARPKGYRSSTWRLQVSRRIQVTNVVRLHFVVIVQIIDQI